MIARSFSLVNEYGQEYSLDDAKKSCLLTEPKGLGYGFSVNYIDIGDAFIRTKMKAKQGIISGTLIFGGGSPYELYEKFSEFVRNSGSMQLAYRIPGKISQYMRKVDLIDVEKTEIEGGVLKCQVKFCCKSLFYSNTRNNFKVSRVKGELRYTWTWPARYNDYSERLVNLSNNGDVEAPFTLEMEGYCENPTITLSKDGEEVAKIKFPLILQPGEKILYSTLDDDMYAYKVDSAGNKTNIIQMLDIRYENFFKIPTGDYGMSFTSDTGAAYTTYLVMYKFYRTV